MKKKKILILSNHPNYTYNFRKEIIFKLLSEKFVVILSTPFGEIINTFIDQGVIFENNSIDRRGKNIFKEVILIKQFYNIMKKHRPDIILTYTIKPNLYGSILSKVFKIPIITNVTGLGSAFGKNRISKIIMLKLYQCLFRKNELVYVQNSYIFELFKTNHIKPLTLELLPGSGVNIDEFMEIDYRGKNPIRILYSGRLLKDKGILELFEAIKYFKNIQNIEFEMIGFIDDELSIELEKMKAYKNFTYYGNQVNVISFIKEASVVILPSHHEGMSNSLLEAAACGRPLLASDIPGCREIIDDNKNGFLFEPKNPKAIIDTILKFVNLSERERSQMGKHSREKVVKEFDRSIIVDRYMISINHILEGE